MNYKLGKHQSSSKPNYIHLHKYKKRKSRKLKEQLSFLLDKWLDIQLWQIKGDLLCYSGGF